MLRTLVLACLLLPAPALTQPLIYRCVDGDGAVSYQQTPCPPAAVARDTIAINPDDVRLAAQPPRIAPAPTPDPMPQPPPAPPPAAPESFRCVTADGTAFYRHDGCPAQLSVRRPYIWAGETPITFPVFVPVYPQAVPRQVACSAIYSRGASRRAGAEHDERYSVYQRATGRDPCR
jgi:hypothetical protein